MTVPDGCAGTGRPPTYPYGPPAARPAPNPWPPSAAPPPPSDPPWAPAGPQPRAYPEPRTPEAFREFARRMLALHQVLPHTAGQMPMCSCGSVARICPVVNAAHELLGHPVPWQPGDPPPRTWTSA